jgi:tRNA A37 threonylcarbamoyladenosine synthetase subunit TsaC/SUA5/YrdC
MSRPTTVDTSARVPTPDSGADDERPPRFLGDRADEDKVAGELAQGRLIGYGFANMYALAARPEDSAVRAANVMKGRPPDQVGSIVTTPFRIPTAFDWSHQPRGLDRDAVLGLMDALFALGPFGFRGPAADTIPAHLSQTSFGIRTTQVIAPGHDCPSNAFVALCLRRTGRDFLYITSANRSRHVSGASEEPAHHRGDALASEFGGEAGLPLLRHPDEDHARSRYPLHAPMSTTVLAFHRIAGRDRDGRVRLVVERHGSLPVQRLERVVRPLGFSLVLGEAAGSRLPQRQYPGRRRGSAGSEGGAVPGNGPR